MDKLISRLSSVSRRERSTIAQVIGGGKPQVSAAFRAGVCLPRGYSVPPDVFWAKEEAQIVSDFTGRLPDGLIKIRNGVAHGDPEITRDMARKRYPVLYGHVTRALKEIVVMPKPIVDDPQGYHQWMFDAQPTTQG